MPTTHLPGYVASAGLPASPGIPVVTIDATDPDAVSWRARNSASTVSIGPDTIYPDSTTALASMADVLNIDPGLIPALADELARRGAALVHRAGGIHSRMTIRVEVAR